MPLRQPSAHSHSNRKLTSREEELKNKEDELNSHGQSKDKNKFKTDKVVNPVWRNDFGKKLKNAFNYYQKW